MALSGVKHITATKRAIAVTMAGALALGGFASTSWAQRDPAYAAARQSGQVGEKLDGYLGIVGSGSPEIQRLVNNINIRRREVYTQRAVAKDSSLQEYALTAGCEAIARTAPGEKYQAPDGSWQTRTSAPPLRDSRCP